MLGAFGHRMQLLDQVFVSTLGLVSVASRPARISLIAVDRGQDQRHGFGLTGMRVAEFAHQRLAGRASASSPAA